MITLTDREMARLAIYVRENFGVDLTKKKELVVSRLSSHVEKLGYADYGKYLDAIEGDSSGDLRQSMIDRLSTNHTFFYREMKGIEHLCDVAVPKLVSQGSKSVRIWSCASSSGQECYTIAMELSERIKAGNGLENYAIYSSDINGEMIAQARLARYPIGELTQIPEKIARRYCSVEGSSFSVAAELRRKVTWERRNLMASFDSLGRFDAVFCRNVMFYFDARTRDDLVRRLYAVIKPGGYLYTGMTETIDLNRKDFCYVAPSIYRKGG